MDTKKHKVAPYIAKFVGKDQDPHYLGYFDCFNRSLFFEAHEVLERLWLAERGETKADFYKGLIQLAGAFVHLQKERLGPAAALFGLAEKNLERFRPAFRDLDVNGVLLLIREWQGMLGASNENPLRSKPAPKLELMPKE